MNTFEVVLLSGEPISVRAVGYVVHDGFVSFDSGDGPTVLMLKAGSIMAIWLRNQK